MAFSISKFLGIFNDSLKALEIFKDTLIDNNDVFSFTGLDKHRENALYSSKKLTIIGILFLCLGFMLQLIGLVSY